MNRKDNPLFGILGDVPTGFQNMGVPKVDGQIIGRFTSRLPASVIILLIEHIAISKSFGRVNNYTINPSQELIAIGITNIFGPFFGAYPATGSFSRTAIKSKAGVRTPFAGVITGAVVLLAIYCLTVVFFYIPDATLSAGKNLNPAIGNAD
jgi:sodium-independent sulfate anion transporter 11